MRGDEITTTLDLGPAEGIVENAEPSPRSSYLARLTISRAARASLLATEHRELHNDLDRLRTKAITR